MADNDEYVVRKMNVKFKKEEYQKYTNGEIHSDNGLRRHDGKLSSLPDIEEIPYEEMDYYANNGNLNDLHYNSDKSNNETTEAIVGCIIAGLLIGIEILSDEQNRKALKSWWENKFLPNIKNTASAISSKASTSTKSIKNIFSNETKANKLLAKENIINTNILDTHTTQLNAHNQKQNREEFKKYISSEEAQQQIAQIKMLAYLLSGKIKDFSDSYVRDDLTPEELMQQQNTIKELTSKEVINSVKMLLENESFALDESTSRIFREFFTGNFIVREKAIPIEIENINL